MKKIWLWVVAAATAVVGVVLLVLTGQRKPPSMPPPPDRPDVPPVDPPIVKLKPATEYEGEKVQPNGVPPHVVITNINERHDK